MLARLFRRPHCPATHPDFDQYDGKYIIPVMGPSGAGKSTFINQLLGYEGVKVGVLLDSCTSEVSAIEVPEDTIVRNLPKWEPTRTKRLILVDNPAFDVTSADDFEILGRIATWLAKSYGDGAKLAGVIYLFDISPLQVTPMERNLLLFKKLCGDDACKSVVLGTTKWDRILENERKLADATEKTLQYTLWKDMIERGSTVQRLERSTSSAWRLIEAVLTKSGRDTTNLQIQVEMVDRAKTLPQTAAGRVLRPKDASLVDRFKKLWNS